MISKLKELEEEANSFHSCFIEKIGPNASENDLIEMLMASTKLLAKYRMELIKQDSYVLELEGVIIQKALKR